MKTKIIMVIAILAIIASSGITAQEKITAQTKFDQFLSKTGQIIRFEDYRLPQIKTDYVIVDAKVRKFSVGSDVKYFLQFSKDTKYGTKTASIEYTDLIEVLKALDVLIPNSTSDRASPIEYLESKFVADGFEIGYYKSKNEIKWYMDLAKYGTDGSVFVSDIMSIKSSMIAGKEKIEAIKN